MSSSESDPRLEEVRQRLIRLLDADEYRVTRRALHEGSQILRD